MKINALGLLKATGLAVALLGSAAIVATVVAPDAAFAKEDKGNGGGNGNGNGGGKGNGGGNGNGNGGGNGNGSGNGNSAKGGGGDQNSASGKGAKSEVGKSRNDKKAGKSGRGDKTSKSSRAGNGKGERRTLRDILSGKGKARNAATNTKGGAHKPKAYAKPYKPAAVKTSIRPVVRTKGNAMAALLGAHPSELGALNAANASETALANASPNSRVGRIATYRDTVLAGEPLREELAEQLEELTGLEPPERTVEEIEEDLATSLNEVQANQKRVEELRQDLIDAGGMDEDIEAQLEQAEADLKESLQEAQALGDERQAAIDYEDATESVQDLADQLEEQELAEREALEAAANKPVTDAVEEEVKSLLGL